MILLSFLSWQEIWLSDSRIGNFRLFLLLEGNMDFIVSFKRPNRRGLKSFRVRTKLGVEGPFGDRDPVMQAVDLARPKAPAGYEVYGVSQG
jgi:hypothetical protein